MDVSDKQRLWIETHISGGVIQGAILSILVATILVRFTMWTFFNEGHTDEAVIRVGLIAGIVAVGAVLVLQALRQHRNYKGAARESVRRKPARGNKAHHATVRYPRRVPGASFSVSECQSAPYQSTPSPGTTWSC